MTGLMLGPDQAEQPVVEGEDVATDLGPIWGPVPAGELSHDLLGDMGIGEHSLVRGPRPVVGLGHLRADAGPSTPASAAGRKS